MAAKIIAVVNQKGGSGKTIGLPGFSGVEATRKIRALTESTLLPISLTMAVALILWIHFKNHRVSFYNSTKRTKVPVFYNRSLTNEYF